MEALATAVTRALPGRASRDEPFGARTTYRVGGPCALWVEATSEDDLAVLHESMAEVAEPVPVLVAGKGSNLLVSDAGFDGVVVALGPGDDAFGWVHIRDTVVRAGGAAGYPMVARRSAAAGLRGLEWAVGVPGSVGGALQMNAGGHGSETARVLERYRCFALATGVAADHGVAELGASYRHSSLGTGDVVLWAEFALRAGSADAAQAEVSEVVRWRREHQPGGSNAGSVFTNPPEVSAGQLIEESGLKGLRLGSAAVSAKHANFIQADDGGSADDVRRLVDHVRTEVARRTGVTLVPELRMVGFADSPPRLVEVTRPAQGSPSSRGRE